MSASYQSDYARAVQRKITWDETRSKAAGLLALGYPKTYVASEVGVHRNTITAWADDPEFAEEVDRLTMMTGAANRSERIRLAMRVIRSRMDEQGIPQSEKDVLEWLKFAQSETHGARLDFGKLAELLTGTGDEFTSLPAPSQQRVIDVAGDSDGSSRLVSDGPTPSDDEHRPPPLATEDTFNPS
jgi:hypothetical protein